MIILRQKIYSKGYNIDSDGDFKSTARGVGLVGTIGTGALVLGNSDAITNRVKAKLSRPEIEDYSNLQIKNGDIVSAERKGGIYNHYGIAEVDPRTGNITIHQYGNRTSLDPRDSYVHTTSLNEFGKGNKVHVERPNGKFTPEEIIQRAKAQAGQKQNYSVLDHNCEHWARNIANGENVSTQANRFGKNPVIRRIINKAKTKRFSKATKAAYNTLFNIRKAVPKEAGSLRLNNLQRNQTLYMTAGGGMAGGVIGDIKSKRKASKEADRLGLERGSEARKRYISKSRSLGRIKGAAIGGGLGAGASKGIDYVRGSKIADGFQEKLKGMDIGDKVNIREQGGLTNLGKAMRGVRSEEDITRMIKDGEKYANSKRDYINGILEHL